MTQTTASIAAPAGTGHQRVLIVDFGSQVTQLIARRVRESGVYCEIHPYDKVEAILDAYAPKAIILSGGPFSVYEEGAPHMQAAIWKLAEERGLPILGICYGHQLIAQQLGGTVGRGLRGEYGRAKVTRDGESALLVGSSLCARSQAAQGIKPSCNSPPAKPSSRASARSCGGESECAPASSAASGRMPRNSRARCRVCSAGTACMARSQSSSALAAKGKSRCVGAGGAMRSGMGGYCPAMPSLAIWPATC